MKGCARTCLLWIVGWGAAAAAFFFYLRSLGGGFDEKTAIFWASAGAGLAVVIALAYVIGIGNAWRERATLLDSITGTPFVDGKWVAASGRIHSMNRLIAPLSGESVVAYKYKIWRMERSGKSSTQVNHFEGKALIPSTIATRQGSVRLLSVPVFDISRAELNLMSTFEKARTYIDATSFETDETPKAQRAGTVEKESTDDDGNFRVDKRSRNAMDVPLDSCSFEEHHIKQDEPVCAFGLYSQARGGLIPHPNWARQTRIMRGDAEAVAGQLRSRMIKYAIGAVIFGAVPFAIVKYWPVHG
jgi:hypothetical protein